MPKIQKGNQSGSPWQSQFQNSELWTPSLILFRNGMLSGSSVASSPSTTCTSKQRNQKEADRQTDRHQQPLVSSTGKQDFRVFLVTTFLWSESRRKLDFT